MPRYKYSRLEVTCVAPRSFGPSQIREAVEHLRTVPGVDDPALYVGLTAITSVHAGEWQLRAKPILKLAQIIGKTPRQVWEMYDTQVDEQIESLVKRQRGFVKLPPPDPP